MKPDTNTLKSEYCKKLFDDSFNNVFHLLQNIAVAYNDGIIPKTPQNKDLMFAYNALCSNDFGVVNTLQRLEGKNLTSCLYDAHKLALYHTFDAVKNACFDFDQSFLDKSLDLDIPVYNIKKTSQKLLVNVARLERDSNPTDKELDKFLEMYTQNRGYRDIQKDFKSLSFVDTNDLKVFRDTNQFLTFVYPNDIPNDFLITISKKDACVNFVNKVPFSRMAPTYKDPQKLLDSTNAFNEITVLRQDNLCDDSHQVLPVALLCTKNITPLEQRVAQKLGLSIILSQNQYTPKVSKKKSLDWHAYIPGKKQISYDFDSMQ